RDGEERLTVKLLRLREFLQQRADIPQPRSQAGRLRFEAVDALETVVSLLVLSLLEIQACQMKTSFRVVRTSGQVLLEVSDRMDLVFRPLHGQGHAQLSLGQRRVQFGCFLKRAERLLVALLL